VPRAAAAAAAAATVQTAVAQVSVVPIDALLRKICRSQLNHHFFLQVMVILNSRRHSMFQVGAVTGLSAAVIITQIQLKYTSSLTQT
jgi:hypothetical protein